MRRASPWKPLRQRLRPRHPDTRVLFVVGAQRSGTSMLLEILDTHPETRVYRERDRAAYDDVWRLRPLAERRRLVEDARCRWVVWKPLLDVQHLDRGLEVHPGARAVFLVRDPRDVALSSVEKWGDAMRSVVRRLAEDAPGSHWLAERLPPDRRAELAAMVHDRLDAVSGAALRWWLRNQIFFDLALDTREQEVLPLRYETLVSEPERALAEVFGLLGLAAPPRAARLVSADRIGRGRDVVLDPVVADTCRALEARLDAVIAARSEP